MAEEESKQPDPAGNPDSPKREEQEQAGAVTSPAERHARVIRSDGRPFGEEERPRVEAYDFRNPVYLGEKEMQRLRLLHEEFVQYLEARFSLFLRMDFLLAMTELRTAEYAQVIREVEKPAHLVLFRSHPLPGTGFLEVNLPLALTVASSILGGKGKPPRGERSLTSIEVDLVDEFLALLLQEWCGQWKREQSLEPQIIGHEAAPDLLQICEQDTLMLVLTMEGQLRGCSGNINLYLPLYMIEDTVRHLRPEHRMQPSAAEKRAERKWRGHYASIPVTGEAIMPLGRRTVREVREWKPGTIVALGEDAMESVKLSLAGRPVFECEAGVDGEKVALRIRKKIGKETADGLGPDEQEREHEHPHGSQGGGDRKTGDLRHDHA
jgi:flagellar motor switch protein FliM